VKLFRDPNAPKKRARDMIRCGPRNIGTFFCASRQSTEEVFAPTLESYSISCAYGAHISWQANNVIGESATNWQALMRQGNKSCDSFFCLNSPAYHPSSCLIKMEAESAFEAEPLLRSNRRRRRIRAGE
jgi:hypothetical protein